MRLLSIGASHDRFRAARKEKETDRCRHRFGDGWQRLPLRDIRAHPRRNPRSGPKPGL